MILCIRDARIGMVLSQVGSEQCKCALSTDDASRTPSYIRDPCTMPTGIVRRGSDYENIVRYLEGLLALMEFVVNTNVLGSPKSLSASGIWANKGLRGIRQVRAYMSLKMGGEGGESGRGSLEKGGRRGDGKTRSECK